MSSTVTIRKPHGSVSLPDNTLWQNRFEIRSESSNCIYVIAQNKETLKFGCSCPGYLSHRKCKHLLDGCGLSLSDIHGRDRLTERASSPKLTAR